MRVRRIALEIRFLRVVYCKIILAIIILQLWDTGKFIMDGGIKLGNIWGIPVRMHLSWMIIILLMTWSLAVGYFPDEYPAFKSPINWVLGFITSMFFAGSVLLHEMGHAYVALRNQVPVKGITLFIFGGVAEMEQEPKTPKAEFHIAIAGPLVSLVLALIFGGLWLIDRQFILLSAPSEWLGRINLTLAVFNMIPGFPLDGGRVLRSVVWNSTNDIKHAARVSSMAGQIIAFGFIGVGIFTILQGQSFSGIWLIFIGWFLQNAAASSFAQVGLRQILQNTRVWQVMSRDLPLIPADISLERLVNEKIILGGKRFFIIVDSNDNNYCGIVTIHEINTIQPDKWGEVTAGEIMISCSEVEEVTPEMSLMEVLQKMDDKNVAQVPVRGAGNTVIGLLSREQILRYVRTRAETSI
ncbi:MAG: site-2 protease family protein [Anaerolineae bacterium]|nr:site-2 protease family protein [Anaerolineae bacterium]